ncbi:Coiled-coil domain-containing protein 103 [Sergentomyia squamirostris]
MAHVEAITTGEILQVYEMCLSNINLGKMRDLRNDAKLRAVNTTATYEEFEDIVNCAHLKPFRKGEKEREKLIKNPRWNTSI